MPPKLIESPCVDIIIFEHSSANPKPEFYPRPVAFLSPSLQSSRLELRAPGLGELPSQLLGPQPVASEDHMGRPRAPEHMIHMIVWCKLEPVIGTQSRICDKYHTPGVSQLESRA